ncbi:MAG TPA: amidase [Nitrolancea sp.]|nr:amidase [Nitrolancea sp.]
MSNVHETDLCFMTIAELAPLIYQREVSPVEVTTAMIERINRHNDEMHAYITVTADVALEQARAAEQEIMAGRYRGPLHGVTISLKDNIATKGIRTSCASRVAPDWLPDEDATVYDRLREAGAILVGKANLFEYAFSMNPAYPNAVNPWNPERTSSGSSSGSGVGVAAGMAHGSIGTDTGGSGRAPANVNGAVGFKATYGRVSRHGLFPLSYTLDHTTMMTRCVRDSALMLQATAGYDARDENSSRVGVPDMSGTIGQPIAGMRLALARGYTHEGIDPDVTAVFDTAIDSLRRLGAEITEVQLPYVRHAHALQLAIMNPEAAEIHHQTHREADDRLGSTALMRLDLGSVIPAIAYIRAQRMRKLMRNAFRELLTHYDAIVSPALAVRPGTAGTWTTIIDGKEIDLRSAGPEYTGIYNLTGMPALVLPAGFSSEGTPIGIQFAGRWFDEPTVLRVAHAFEQTTGWPKRPPFPKEDEMGAFPDA